MYTPGRYFTASARLYTGSLSRSSRVTTDTLAGALSSLWAVWVAVMTSFCSVTGSLAMASIGRSAPSSVSGR